MLVGNFINSFGTQRDHGVLLSMGRWWITSPTPEDTKCPENGKGIGLSR